MQLSDYEFCDWVVVRQDINCLTYQLVCQRCNVTKIIPFEDVERPTKKMTRKRLFQFFVDFVKEHEKCKVVIEREFRKIRSDVL